MTHDVIDEKPVDGVTHLETFDGGSDASERANVDPHFVTAADSKHVLRKADLNVMPVFCAIVALQFLDKTALTYTSIMGILYDTKMTGNKYAWLGSIFSIGLLVGQYPMCYLQQRLPLSKFTALCIITWGLIVALTSLCHTWSQLMVCRFFLGVFESSINPALVLFTAQWYRKNEQGLRVGIWASFTTWGGVLGAGVAYALYKADARKGALSMHGWRILFIILGCLTVTIGIVFLFVVPDRPETAWFLKPEERKIATKRTAENMEALNVKEWKWSQVKDAFTDPQVLLMTLVSFLNAIPNGGITNFYAILVLGLGIRPDIGILLSMLNCWVAVVTILALGLGNKFRCRTLFGAAPHLISMIGGILVWQLPYSAKKARLASFYLTLVYAIAATACMSLISSNVTGRTKKTTTAVMFFVMGCVGNLIGPQTFRDKDAPRYTPALITITVCNILTVITMVCLWAYYKAQNAKRDKLAQTNPEEAAADMSPLAIHDMNLRDLTDRQNLHFRYNV